MSHFAKINAQGIVEQVIVAEQDFINSLLDSSSWVQTSYNTHGGQHPEGQPLRKNYAGIGYTYDSIRDAFIPPQPHLSWTLDEQTCLWNAPISRPEDGRLYTWNEETQQWDLYVIGGETPVENLI
jgi:hypothetical protein